MAGRFCGHIDPPLSEQGLGQLAATAQTLVRHPLSHIFSSDLLRARQTADSIAAYSGLHVEVLPALRELNFGEWEGLSWTEVSARYPEHAQLWMEQYPLLSAPGGENFRDLQIRVRDALTQVADCTFGGCALVVTHGGFIRTAILMAQKLPDGALASLECGYACYVELCRSGGNWELRK
jgi:broad specificity phosphatase PhoE